MLFAFEYNEFIAIIITGAIEVSWQLIILVLSIQYEITSRWLKAYI